MGKRNMTCAALHCPVPQVPGECPYLTGEYGSYIIQGTQWGDGGSDSRYLQAASTMKHWPMYDLEVGPMGRAACAVTASRMRRALAVRDRRGCHIT